MNCLAYNARDKTREPAPEGYAWGGAFQCSCGEQYRFYVPVEFASGLIERYREKAKIEVRQSHPEHPDRLVIPTD